MATWRLAVIYILTVETKANSISKRLESSRTYNALCSQIFSKHLKYKVSALLATDAEISFHWYLSFFNDSFWGRTLQIMDISYLRSHKGPILLFTIVYSVNFIRILSLFCYFLQFRPSDWLIDIVVFSLINQWFHVYRTVVEAVPAVCIFSFKALYKRLFN